MSPTDECPLSTPKIIKSDCYDLVSVLFRLDEVTEKLIASIFEAATGSHDPPKAVEAGRVFHC